MALDADHTAFFSEGEELVLQILVAGGHYKAYIHAGAVFLFCGTDKEGVAVNLIIKEIGFFHIDLVDSLYAAD